MRAPSRMTAAAVGGLVLLCACPSLAARAERVSGPAGRARGVDCGRVDPGASSRTSRARRSPAPWSRRSARRRRSRSPIGAAGSSSARCRRVPISSARISAGSWRRADRSIDVRPSARASSSIALRHASAGGATAVLSGARGGRRRAGRRRGADRRRGHAGRAERRRTAQPSGPRHSDDHGETAWRLRHARRAILKTHVHRCCRRRVAGRRRRLRSRRISGTPDAFARRGAATSFFADTPFSGQVNLLTTGSFDTPQQLFSADNFARSIAYVSRWARRSASRPTGRCAARSRRPTSRRGSSPARTRRARPPGTGTTSACRTARSATTAAIPRRCAT